MAFQGEMIGEYLKHCNPLEASIKIWGFRQRVGETTVAWGERCRRALHYRLTREVAECKGHKKFMTENELGLKPGMDKHYEHARYVTQAYFDNTMRYLKDDKDAPSPPWN